MKIYVTKQLHNLNWYPLTGHESSTDDAALYYASFDDSHLLATVYGLIQARLEAIWNFEFIDDQLCLASGERISVRPGIMMKYDDAKARLAVVDHGLMQMDRHLVCSLAVLRDVCHAEERELISTKENNLLEIPAHFTKHYTLPKWPDLVWHGNRPGFNPNYLCVEIEEDAKLQEVHATLSESLTEFKEFLSDDYSYCLLLMGNRIYARPVYLLFAQSVGVYHFSDENIPDTASMNSNESDNESDYETASASNSSEESDEDSLEEDHNAYRLNHENESSSEDGDDELSSEEAIVRKKINLKGNIISILAPNSYPLYRHNGIEQAFKTSDAIYWLKFTDTYKEGMVETAYCAVNLSAKSAKQLHKLCYFATYSIPTQITRQSYFILDGRRVPDLVSNGHWVAVPDKYINLEPTPYKQLLTRVRATLFKSNSLYKKEAAALKAKVDLLRREITKQNHEAQALTSQLLRANSFFKMAIDTETRKRADAQAEPIEAIPAKQPRITTPF